MEKKQKRELDDATHQEILDAAARRFPLESYQQLRATGLSRREAAEMLGFSERDVPREDR